MKREFSAGGVVVKRMRGDWHVAVIRPGGKRDVWALPKGNVASGERPGEAATREVLEETGIHARLVGKLGDVRYVYTWRGERIFKVVSFFLLRAGRGRLGVLHPAHAHEVEEARWVPLASAPSVLTYRGERDMAAAALALVTERGDAL